MQRAVGQGARGSVVGGGCVDDVCKDVLAAVHGQKHRYHTVVSEVCCDVASSLSAAAPEGDGMGALRLGQKKKRIIITQASKFYGT